VKNLAWEYTRSPFEIEIEPETVTVEEVDQILYHVPSDEKMRFLLGVLQREQPESAIVFCNTKRYTEIVAKRLRMNGYDCEFIIGDLPQTKRLKVIEDVKAGKTKLLVATDVAARGLDIEGLAMVVNYDLPNEAENYVHRIGRTARAGKTGKAVTLASEQDVYELPAIERYIGQKIPSEIATPELHAEDASEGRYIQTDVYDDRGGDRQRGGEGRRRVHSHDRGGQGRSSQGGTGHHDRGQARSGRRTEEHRGKKGENRTEKRPLPPRSPVPKAALPPPQSPVQDPYKLSSEERMAMYKEKYNAKKPGKTDRSRKPKSAGQQPTGRHSEGMKETSRSQKRAEQTAPAVPAAAVPAKKGILSRLLGIFKKR
jgi:ATP-dependent RNA helicase RhlB